MLQLPHPGCNHALRFDPLPVAFSPTLVAVTFSDLTYRRWLICGAISLETVALLADYNHRVRSYKPADPALMQPWMLSNTVQTLGRDIPEPREARTGQAFLEWTNGSGILTVRTWEPCLIAIFVALLCRFQCHDAVDRRTKVSKWPHLEAYMTRSAASQSCIAVLTIHGLLEPETLLSQYRKVVTDVLNRVEHLQWRDEISKLFTDTTQTTKIGELERLDNQLLDLIR